MRLRPTQVVLLGVFALALSLAGVPFLLGSPDTGALRGVAVDSRGFGVAGASVFLFQEQELRMLEETRTDDDGDFEFLQATTGTRVFVRPEPGSGLLPAWSPSEAEGETRLALVLHPARALEVHVRDPQGAPIPLAEVRVYTQRTETVVLATARTDARGSAHLPAPAQAHVAVLAPREPRLMRWRFDLAIPEAGLELEFSMPSGESLGGVVRGPEGPLANIVLVSWEEGSLDGWNGFARSDERGCFTLPRTPGPTLVRAQDPSGAHLPARVRATTVGEEGLEIHLEAGAPQIVRTTRNGLPLEAFVWSWSPEAEVWSWGARSSPAGRATVPVGERFSIRAEPLDPAFGPMEAWDVPYRTETLRLEASPRR